jgi:hypothetical protein
VSAQSPRFPFSKRSATTVYNRGTLTVVAVRTAAIATARTAAVDIAAPRPDPGWRGRHCYLYRAWRHRFVGGAAMTGKRNLGRVERRRGKTGLTPIRRHSRRGRDKSPDRGHLSVNYDANYDARDDINRSVAEGFRVIRARKAAGGPGWSEKEAAA